MGALPDSSSRAERAFFRRSAFRSTVTVPVCAFDVSLSRVRMYAAVGVGAETLEQDVRVVARSVSERLPTCPGDAPEQRDVFLKERPVPLVPFLA